MRYPLNAQTMEYSKENALAMGQAASLVYKDWEVVRLVVKAWGLPYLEIFDQGDTQAFMAGSMEFAVLSFRGTEAIGDWATNVQISFAEDEIGKVHAGFLKALDLIWPDLLRKIKMVNVGQPFFITGHSLGGALATLAAARLLYGGEISLGGLYTFGSPRAMSKESAADFDAAWGDMVHRYVNNNDVVPRVPLARVHGYAHVGTFHYFRETGEQDDEISWAAKLLDKIHGRIADIFSPGTDGIKDHFMDSYLRNIELAAKYPAEKKERLPPAIGEDWG